MANLNKVQLIGNITRDPEVKYTPKGTAVTDLGLAINRFYSTDNGEKREEVTFVDVTLWGRQAEIAGEYCKKGRSIYIEGRLQLDSWEDKVSGQKRNKLRVIGENIQLLGSRPGASSGETAGSEGGEEERSYTRSSRSGSSSASRPVQPSSSKMNDEDDDVPF
ncbi:MAG: single-stranded DNA-binding protein [Chthoniobacterales bacterium]|nr:single-stranded DNA-binding protein [Chthoniobacterales bacterium]